MIYFILYIYIETNRYDDTISFVYEQKLQLFYMIKINLIIWAPQQKKRCIVIHVILVILFCLKLITSFYLNVIFTIKNKIFQFFLEYVLCWNIYYSHSCAFYNIVTSEIKGGCCKKQNREGLDFISFLITVH